MTLWLRWMRALLVAIPALLTLFGVNTGEHAPYVAYALLSLLVLRAAERWPSRRRPLLLLELGLFAWFGYRFPHGVLYLLPFSTLIAAYAGRPGLREAVAWTLIGGMVPLDFLHEHRPELLAPVALLWTAWSGVLYAGSQHDSRRERTEQLYDELAASHEQLELARRRLADYAAQIEEYTRLAERNRIAADIHDDLGHRLIRVKMMSEAALQLIGADPERAGRLVEQMRDQLQDGMEQMRQTVRRLASPEADDARRYALDRLVREAGESMGIDVRFEIAGIPRPLYPSAEWILYQNAQEAITNAVRHGAASVVDVCLQYRPDGVAMIVSNDGKVPDGAVSRGLGLKGMAERVRMAGGSLAVSSEGRFSVTTFLPYAKPINAPKTEQPGG
ncbi:sensor histidine kinase [Paenibacillus thermoaerophilus]|uniref:histidine kinase n=1 Tax=Paenibacillus thermoaerophilus TaxID=1215385 RepID=A0ABW2UXB2_9BACL|nr:sensor histidine kinase [Paenibacillus thermoaerophilus]TMV17364.1 sensor histidine kinase [Paenibacillus thermoaerophilus]